MNFNKIIKLVFFLIFLILASDVFADTFIDLPLNYKTTNGKIGKVTLHYGIATNATYGVDTTYGEWDVPNHPPSGLDVLFDYVDSTTNDAIYPSDMSYFDFRPIESTNVEFKMKYILDIQNDITDTLVFYWNNLPNIVDSAFLTYDIDGKVLLAPIDMKKNNQGKITNPLMSNVFIYVWYNMLNADVKENSSTTLNSLSEQVTDNLKLNFIEPITSYEIYNLLGSLVKNNQDNNFPLNKTELFVGNLTPGFYYGIFHTASANVYRINFIKY